MNTRLLLPCALLSYVTLVSSWQYFVSILDRPLYNSAREPLETHTEYTFGDCNNRDNVLYMHVRLDHYQVLGKLIVRGWINIQRIPRCIILRAKSYDVDRFRTTAYPFQICVPRITYCHTHRRYKYFYYEWYIPFEYIGGMDWDIYFLGSPNLDWQ